MDEMPLEPRFHVHPDAEPRREKLCSRNSRQRAFAAFVNKTRKEVTLEWLDFRGNHVSYKDRMRPQEVMQLNTFVGHPWLFYDADYRHPLAALPDRKWVYMPQGYEGGPLSYRPVFIVSPFTSLQHLCLKALHVQLVKASQHDSEIFRATSEKLTSEGILLKTHCEQLKVMEQYRVDKNMPFYIDVSTTTNT